MSSSSSGLPTLAKYLGANTAAAAAIPVDAKTLSDEEHNFFKARGKDSSNNLSRIGLALSGGGIRSATFNLGIVSALAGRGWLSKLDYISAVSGGAYIAGWLSAWIYRAGLKTVEGALAAAQLPGSRAPAPVKFLRQYSNYLTPRIGGFSSDTWAMIAIYFRNLTLTLSVIVPSLACALLLPRLAVTLLRSDTYVSIRPDGYGLFFEITWLIVPVLLILLFTARSLHKKGRTFAAQLVWCLFLGSQWFAHLIFIGAFSSLAKLLKRFTYWMGTLIDTPKGYTLFTAFCIAVFGGCIYLAVQQYLIKVAAVLPESTRRVLKTTITTIALAIFLFLCSRSMPLIQAQIDYLTSLPDSTNALFLFTAGVLIITFLSLMILNFTIGLFGSWFSEHQKEALGRFSGDILLLNIKWAVLCTFGLLAPYALYVLSTALQLALFMSLWLGPTVLSIALSFDVPRLRRLFAPDLREMILNFAPYVFLAGLLTIIAYGISYIGFDIKVVLTFQDYLENAYQSCKLEAFWLAALLSTTALVFSARFGINQYSLHLFYRNRLIRAYLGASNPTRASTYAGFDDTDDIRMADFADPKKYTGPYLLFNASLNLVSGEELAWQERKAANFLFSPLYCGFDTSQFPRIDQPDLRQYAYRPTKDYAYPSGVTLGTVIALSGAAVSTNMGRYTSPRTGFLLSVFNVRLGWWLSNPRHTTSWNQVGPRSRIDMLWREFTSGTSDRGPYVYLSDGGHFENLGVYELISRRLGLIICSDASHDPNYTCDDFGRAIEKCRADFACNIDIDLGPIRRREARYVVGRIDYGNDTGTGVLIYIRPTMMKSDPEDLQCYKLNNCHFPHDSTANQWFLESQFEAYRILGEVTGRAIVGQLENDSALRLGPLTEDEVSRVRAMWAGT